MFTHGPLTKWATSRSLPPGIADSYKRSAEQFRQRNMSKEFKKVIFFNLISSLLFGSLGFCFARRLAKSYPALDSKFFSVAATGIGLFIKPKMAAPVKGLRSYITETKLSENMKKLADTHSNFGLKNF